MKALRLFVLAALLFGPAPSQAQDSSRAQRADSPGYLIAVPGKLAGSISALRRHRQADGLTVTLVVRAIVRETPTWVGCRESAESAGQGPSPVVNGCGARRHWTLSCQSCAPKQRRMPCAQPCYLLLP